MKPVLAAVSLAVALLSAHGAFAAEQTATLAVEKMYCELCPAIVKKSLAKVPGVSHVDVSYEKKTAIVTYDDQKATLETLTAATTGAGYPSHAVK